MGMKQNSYDELSASQAALEETERMNHLGFVFEVLYVETDVDTDEVIDIVGVVGDNSIETHLEYVVRSTSDVGIEVWEGVTISDENLALGTVLKVNNVNRRFPDPPSDPPDAVLDPVIVNLDGAQRVPDGERRSGAEGSLPQASNQPGLIPVQMVLRPADDAETPRYYLFRITSYADDNRIEAYGRFTNYVQGLGPFELNNDDKLPQP